MGPRMTATTQESSRQIKSASHAGIPPALMDVAYVGGATCAAAGAMSLSQWHELVKAGIAPEPVIRKPRFTRWLLADLRRWLIEFRTQSDFEADSATALEKATRASHAAKAKASLAQQLNEKCRVSQKDRDVLLASRRAVSSTLDSPTQISALQDQPKGGLK